MTSKLTIAAVASVALLALAGCSAGASGSAPLPQAPASAAAKPAAKAPAAKAPVAAPVVEAPAADAASSCDVVREALLTGSPADVASSMKALIADKTAPAIAREYARYYTVRDKGNKDLQTMDESLITSSCM